MQKGTGIEKLVSYKESKETEKSPLSVTFVVSVASSVPVQVSFVPLDSLGAQLAGLDPPASCRPLFVSQEAGGLA
jgi:hypothetical protein